MLESGIGFGLGFLNFLGTVLFFMFLFGMFRMLAWGSRGGGCSGHSRKHWKSMRRHWKHQMMEHDAPLRIVRERYARGEIDREAYLDMTEALGGRPEQEVRHQEKASEWRPPFMQDRALEVARHRLAQGEITPEQFEAIRRTLQD